MDCKQAKKLIPDLLYGELTSEIASEAMDHIAKCEDCLEYRAGLQQTLKYLDQIEKPDLPLDFAAAVHDAIDRETLKKAHPRRRLWPVLATAIGLCGIILSIFTILASEIRYEDGALIIRFREQQTAITPDKSPDKSPDNAAKILADFREEQLRLQRQSSDEMRTKLHASINDDLRGSIIDELRASLTSELHSLVDSKLRASLTDELSAAIAELSRAINEYESRRDKKVAEAIQQLQMQQHQLLLTLQQDLEVITSRTEGEFMKTYLTMAELANQQAKSNR